MYSTLLITGRDLLSGDMHKRITAKVDEVLQPRLQYHANRKLDAALAKKPNESYALEIDGRTGSDRSQFATAKRRIVIRFVLRALSIAVEDLARALQRNIMNKGAREPWINTPNVAGAVKIFYGGVGKPITEVSGEIKSFLPGDVIMLVPDATMQIYANVTKYGAGGAMRAASASIRRLLSVSKRSAIVVRAERSRAAYAHLKTMNRGRGGKPWKPTAPKDLSKWKGAAGTWESAWVISIRYSKRAVLRSG